MINIPKNIIDPFYRYQRQEIKISSLKLGIKIDNLDDVSKAIYLNPKTIMTSLINVRTLKSIESTTPLSVIFLIKRAEFLFI